MSKYVTTPNLIANGTINVSSFVVGDPSNAFYALQAGVGSSPIGISQAGSNTFPDGSVNTTPVAAVAGQSLEVFGAGAEVLLTLGTGGCTPFSYLKPDANGAGVVANPGEPAGAYALQSGNAGDKVRVIVLPPMTQIVGATSTTAVNATLTAGQSGIVVFVTAADVVVTLPPASTKGLRYRIVAAATTAALQAGTTGVALAVNGTDKMYGNAFTAAAGKGALNTKATANQGDTVSVISDGTSWAITDVVGTWARQA